MLTHSLASSFGEWKAADLPFEAVNLEVTAVQLLLLSRARFIRQQPKGGQELFDNLKKR